MRTEPWLVKPGRTAGILKKYGFRFQKRFGQNFLLEPDILDQIIAAAEVNGEDFIIEIGPGIGTLTQYLSYYGGNVCAIEIDRRLMPILEETLADWDNAEVLKGDIMQMNLRELIAEKSDGRTVKIVANLPYYITTPIVMKILEEELPVESVTVMVQKEVADRMQAAPGTSAYGALSLAVQYYTIPEVRAYVPPESFVPRPKVGSSVIRLTRKRRDEMTPVRDKQLMFRVIRAAFGQRRKKLVNALANAETLSFSKEEVTAAMEACGIDPGIRGEKLGLEDFAKLSDFLGGGVQAP